MNIKFTNSENIRWGGKSLTSLTSKGVLPIGGGLL